MKTRKKLINCAVLALLTCMILFAGPADRSKGNTSQSCNVNLVGLLEGGPCYSTAVNGNIVYCGFGNALVVLDVTDKTNPVRVRSFFTRVAVLSVSVSGIYLFAAADVDGLICFDISTPYEATLIGLYDTGGSARDVAISGQYAYIADGSEGVRVIDIPNPAHLTEVGCHPTATLARGIVVISNRA